MNGTTTPHVTFDSLPIEVQSQIYGFLDVPSICRAYVAFTPSTAAEAAAAIINKEWVSVSPFSLEGDLVNISFSLLAKLPPCRVSVFSTYGIWRRIALQLNQIEKIKELQLTINGEFSKLSECFRCLRHPLHVLKLKCVAIDEHDIPQTVKELNIDACAMISTRFAEHLPNLQKLDLMNMVDYATPFSLPQSIVNVALPGNFNVDNYNLPHLTTADIEDDDRLPWQQMESVFDCGIPDVSRLDNLKRISVDKMGPLISFRDIDCPKLENVTICRANYIHDYNADVSELFTESQMAKLVTMIVFDYQVSNYDPFVRLTKIRTTFNQPLTENFPLPPNLIDLNMDTSFSVKGIPPQLLSFGVENLDSSDGTTRDITINAPNIRKMVLLGYHNVSLTCPKLHSLRLESISGTISLNTPNLTGLVLTHIAIPFPVEQHSSLSSLIIRDLIWDEFVMHRYLKQFATNEVSFKTLEVNADEVELEETFVTDFVKITANRVFLDAKSKLCPAENMSLSCRVLEAPLIDSRHYQGVEYYDISISQYYHEEVHSDTFKDCSKLIHLRINLQTIVSSEEAPILIPASVKTLIVADATADQLWFKFEDETRLEHLEITYWNDTRYGVNRKGPIPAYFNMDMLGLTAIPPSFYCPRLQGGITSARPLQPQSDTVVVTRPPLDDTASAKRRRTS